MKGLSIIGCGFVADLYMRSLAQHTDITVHKVYDRDPARKTAFAEHWNVASVDTLEQLFQQTPESSVILNLTNPTSHFEINQACLDAGFHVYSEKPLAVTMQDAFALHNLAKEKGLMLGSAPCSFLGEAAQTLGAAIRKGTAGPTRLVYAELDDGFISQAPYKDWISESGAPWPSRDEFETGCTLEHAGYYLAWLIVFFGSVERVVAASAKTVPDKLNPDTDTPDFSVATLFFKDGPVVRLTCSIVAPHNHTIRVVGDKGVLQVKKAWDNSAPVKFYKRRTLRRRLIDSPFGKRLKPHGKTHPKVARWGAASMNFALGPAEMLAALSENRACRVSSDFALHLNEVTLAIQNAGADTGSQVMQTACGPVDPLPWAQVSP